MSLESKVDEIINRLNNIEALIKSGLPAITPTVDINTDNFIDHKKLKKSGKGQKPTSILTPERRFKILVDVRNHFNEQQLLNHIKTNLPDIIKRRINDPEYFPHVQFDSNILVQEKINTISRSFYKEIQIYNIAEEKKINNKALKLFEKLQKKLKTGQFM